MRGENYADHCVRCGNRACDIFGATIRERPTNYGTGQRERDHHVRPSKFAFDPDHLRLKAGVPVRLRLMNESNGGHDFSSPAFLAARSGLLGGSFPNRHSVASRTVSGSALWQSYCNKIS
jgi:hypothetical protein